MEKNVPQGDPLVSIRCLVYNHEPYLRQCLDGFVMQETTFPFEAIVHDDASTDGSAAIIREYAERYPHIIKPIYETENQWGKGTINKTMAAAIHPSAKYIATCEGDDYWTDPHKLQIQVDFLESHPDYYMTCHAFDLYFEDAKKFESHRFVNYLQMYDFKGYKFCVPSLDDFWKGPWFTQVLTIVRRRTEYIDSKTLKRYRTTVDYITCYYMMRAGKCALFEDVMGIYRKHEAGVFTSRDGIRWVEVEMDNYYCLYELETEKHVLPILDKNCSELFLSYLKKKRIHNAFMLVFRHIRRVPVKHSFNCILMILRKLMGSAWRNIKGGLL